MSRYVTFILSRYVACRYVMLRIFCLVMLRLFCLVMLRVVMLCYVFLSRYVTFILSRYVTCRYVTCRYVTYFLSRYVAGHAWLTRDQIPLTYFQTLDNIQGRVAASIFRAIRPTIHRRSPGLKAVLTSARTDAAEEGRRAGGNFERRWPRASAPEAAEQTRSPRAHQLP